MRLDDALSSYVLQLSADGRSPHTVNQVRRHIGAFAAWIGADTDLDAISTSDVARYMVAPATTEGRSTATQNAVRSSLRTFFSFVHAAGYAHTNPGRLLRLAKRAPAPPRGFSDDEIRRLLDVLSRAKGTCARRDRLLIEVMLRAGIRIGSALALDRGDVDLDRHELVLTKTKGDAPERVPISRELADHLRGYVDGRDAGALFARTDGTRLGQRQAQRRIEGWLRSAGVWHGSAHSMRHSFALGIYRRTRDVLVVSRALRHRALSSTMAYARATEDDVRRAIEA